MRSYAIKTSLIAITNSFSGRHDRVLDIKGGRIADDVTGERPLIVQGHVPGVVTFNGGLREALSVAAVMAAASLAITAVVLPRRSESVPLAKISTTTSIAAAVPARSHHDH